MNYLNEIRTRLKMIPGWRESDDLKALRAVRGGLINDAGLIIETVGAEDRDLTKDEEQLFNRLHAEARMLETKIGEQVSIQEEARTAAERDINGRTDGTVGPVFALENGEEVRALTAGECLADRYDRSQSRARFGRMVRGLITGDWTGADSERRAAGESIGSGGGFFIPAPVAAGVIDLARNQSVLVRAGGLTLPMKAAEMTLVRQVSDVTGDWRAEHKKITESDASFEPIRLKAMTLAALTRISIELMEDAPAFGAMIEEAMGAALGLEIDRAGLFGTGAGEPLGIVNTPGVNKVSMGPNGAALTNYDTFLDAIEAVENANGMVGAVAYAPRTKRALAGLKNTQNDPLRPPQDFLDIKRFSSNQFPVTEKQGTATNASTALLGDYSQVAFAVRTGLTLEATRTGDADAFSQLEVLIRGYLRADIAVLRPAHFTKIVGIKPA